MADLETAINSAAGVVDKMTATRPRRFITALGSGALLAGGNVLTNNGYEIIGYISEAGGIVGLSALISSAVNSRPSLGTGQQGSDTVE